MKDDIKFWCAVGVVKQLAFNEDGSTREVEIDAPVGEAHIVYSEILMCRQSRNTLMNNFKAKKQRTVQTRPLTIKLCEKCEKKYKENQDLAWQKWINPPEIKGERTVTIKPEVIQK